MFLKILFPPSWLGKGTQFLLRPRAFVHYTSYITVHGCLDLTQCLMLRQSS